MAFDSVIHVHPSCGMVDPHKSSFANPASGQFSRYKIYGGILTLLLLIITMKKTKQKTQNNNRRERGGGGIQNSTTSSKIVLLQVKINRPEQPGFPPSPPGLVPSNIAVIISVEFAISNQLTYWPSRLYSHVLPLKAECSHLNDGFVTKSMTLHPDTAS